MASKISPRRDTLLNVYLKQLSSKTNLTFI